MTRIAVQSTAATGIEQPSWIMVDKITTMSRANLRDQLGSRMQISSGSTAR